VVGEVVELDVPARADFLAVVRMVVTAVAHLHPEYDDEQIDDLRLAVSEACTNAIEAHAASETPDRVSIACSASDDRLEVRILDRGGGFDPHDLRPHPPVTDPDRPKFERGLGIPLIRALADEAEFESTDEGTVVRLVIVPSPLEFQT
jgi:serine/threonine-protein kinase RsbW